MGVAFGMCGEHLWGMSGKKAIFDSTKYVQYSKNFRQKEGDIIFKPLLLGQYIKWQENKEPPFKMTRAQAVAAWHKDLADPKMKKTEVQLYNPESKKVESFTRVHVLFDELEHRKNVEEEGKVFEKSSSSKAPPPAVLNEMKDRFQSEDKQAINAFMSGEVELAMSFEDEDCIIGSRTGKGHKRGNKKSKTFGGGGSGGGKAPKIRDLAVLIAGKLPALLPRVEQQMNFLKQTEADALAVLTEQNPEVALTFKNLVEKNVQEKDIDECIRKGTDPFDLGRTKTIFKCLFQFAKRAVLASAFRGASTVLSMDLGYIENCAEQEHQTQRLRDLVRRLVHVGNIF